MVILKGMFIISSGKKEHKVFQLASKKMVRRHSGLDHLIEKVTSYHLCLFFFKYGTP
jgi:hypothetical protein